MDLCLFTHRLIVSFKIKLSLTRSIKSLHLPQPSQLTTELCGDAFEAVDHLNPLQALLASDQQQVQQEEEEQSCGVHQLDARTVEVEKQTKEHSTTGLYAGIDFELSRTWLILKAKNN